MRRIESIQPAVDIIFKLTGIKQEFPELDRQAALMLLVRSCWHVLKNHSIIKGSLPPREDAAILVGNHNTDGDIYKTVVAVAGAGRLIGRTVVKRSLVDPSPEANESPEYLASIGDKHDEYNRFSPTRAYTLSGVGVIPIVRDNPGTEFLKKCDQVLKTGQLLGFFIQPTRYKDCLLRNLQPGPAFFAIRHPDIRVCPMAFSGPPDGRDRMVVLPPFTYAQLSKEYGRRISAAELTIIIADRIAEGLPARVQKDWIETTRAAEITRLTSPRRPITIHS